MILPDCYDPAAQAERRELAWDRRVEHFPTCGCCGGKIYPEEHYWQLRTLNICERCKQDMEEGIYYDEMY